ILRRRHRSRWAAHAHSGNASMERSLPQVCDGRHGTMIFRAASALVRVACNSKRVAALWWELGLDLGLYGVSHDPAIEHFGGRIAGGIERRGRAAGAGI